MTIWQTPDDEARAYDRLNALPAARLQDAMPGMADGILLAPFKGLAAGGANLALVAGESFTPALRPLAQSFDEHFGTGVDDWLHGQLETTRQAVITATPKAHETGLTGRIVHGLFEVGGEAVLGAVVGGLPGAVLAAGSGQGFAAYARGSDAGLDASTALKMAAIEGITTGIGVAIPVAGRTLMSSIALGAGSGVGLGVAQRGMSSQVLENAGYPDMAAQHRMLDAEAIAADVILGTAFGVLGYKMASRTPPRRELAVAPEVDAALVVAAARHAESTAPGIPTDAAAANLHADSFNAALEALLHDRPVDVAAKMPETSDAVYVVDPRAPELEAAKYDAAAEYLALEQEAQRAHSPRNVVDPELDSLAVAVAKLGGLDRDQVRSEWGASILDEAKELNRLGPFGKPVIRATGGRLLDDMVEVLAERGYLPVDEHGKADINTLFDALRSEAAGDAQFTPAGIEANQRRRVAEDELMRRQAGDREAAEERAAIQADNLPPELAELPVTNERGETRTAREAYAELQTEHLERARERRMVEAAATCEAALS